MKKDMEKKKREMEI